MPSLGFLYVCHRPDGSRQSLHVCLPYTLSRLFLLALLLHSPPVAGTRHTLGIFSRSSCADWSRSLSLSALSVASFRCAITITGEALTHALSTAENRRYFFGLANLCSTVIACRVSPKQKSEVVTQCKRYQSGTVSLGIGDGANDVGMLVAANVGVGIQGKEGLQAVRAADFAIGEFK